MTGMRYNYSYVLPNSDAGPVIYLHTLGPQIKLFVQIHSAVVSRFLTTKLVGPLHIPNLHGYYPWGPFNVTTVRFAHIQRVIPEIGRGPIHLEDAILHRTEIEIDFFGVDRAFDDNVKFFRTKTSTWHCVPLSKTALALIGNTNNCTPIAKVFKTPKVVSI